MTDEPAAARAAAIQEREAVGSAFAWLDLERARPVRPGAAGTAPGALVGPLPHTMASMCSGHDTPRPNPGSAWRNFTGSDAPLPRRLRQFAANSWWKVRHGQGCCGHYGQPGC